VKRFFSFLVLLLATAQLFASTYIINSYSYEVDGKTKKFALAEFVGEPGDSFSSEADLKKFLEDKKQQLWNKRVFLELEYSYELTPNGDDFDVDVFFYVKDAKTFLIIPFPKYDSNYGFSFKAKAKDANFLGTFTTMDSSVEITQEDNSFKEGTLDWDFTVDSLRVKEAKLTFSHQGALDFQKWTNSYLGLSAKISNVKVKELVFNGSVNFRYSPNVNDRSSEWKPKTLSTSFGVSFKNPKMRSANASNSLSYTFSNKLFTTNTSFSFKLSNKLNITSTSNLYTTQYGFDDGLTYIRVGTGVSKGFTLFKKISFSPSVMMYVGYTLKSETYDPYYVLSLPFSHGRIDWVANNFRKGFKFSLTGTDTYHFLNNEDGFHSLYLTGNATAHYPVTSWFNPSARISTRFDSMLSITISVPSRNF